VTSFIAARAALGHGVSVGTSAAGQQTLFSFSASLPLSWDSPVSQFERAELSLGPSVSWHCGGSSRSVTAIGGHRLPAFGWIAFRHRLSVRLCQLDSRWNVLDDRLAPGPYRSASATRTTPTHRLLRAGATGNFTLDVSAVAGQYVAVPASGATLGTIVLPLGRSISGVVTDTNGNPLSGIFVYPCEQHDGGRSTTAATAKLGTREHDDRLVRQFSTWGWLMAGPTWSS